VTEPIESTGLCPSCRGGNSLIYILLGNINLPCRHEITNGSEGREERTLRISHPL